MRAAVTFAFLCVSAAAALGQPQPSREAVLRVAVDPPSTVVGQKATLKIDVLAPNYMTKPPVLPDFQIRNAVTRPGSTINLSEQINGETFAGVRYEFLIYPQEPGRYAISGQSVTITYAADPPNTREAVMAIPAIGFDATIPDAAQTLDPFVAASHLTVQQEVRRSSEQLKVGDSVTRTVTVTADGTPAMLLPPTTFARQDGVEIYPAQPELQDRFDRRADTLSATRVDQATYMLQRAGDVTLPAVEVGWWNIRDERIERTRLEAIVLHVDANPSEVGVRSEQAGVAHNARGLLFLLLDHWIALLLAVAVFSALVWILPAAMRATRDWNRQRRARYLQSEAFAYSGFRAAARGGDAGKTYFALLNWISRFGPTAHDRTISGLKAVAHDPALDAEVAAVENRLFGEATDAVSWSPRTLAGRVAAARSRLRRQKVAAGHSLPVTLNPRTALTPQRWRPVAR